MTPSSATGANPGRRRSPWAWNRRSVRTTVMPLALVPSLILVAATTALAARQTERALRQRAWANEARIASSAGISA
ncbi:hypothetical protein [Nocardia barduliensis]|uniref:hypothetical protein n=1 Tax=Nocardia barduliensis TaxID=2736643 RepID=UPI0015746899|nr:hypothetical protein [Nocardia barduliensis]